MPKCIPGFLSDPVVDLSASSAHVALVTAAGRLYTFGDGSLGQLGTGDWGEAWRPTPVSVRDRDLGDDAGDDDGLDEVVVRVGAGPGVTVVLTSSGRVFASGVQLGAAAARPVSSFCPVEVDLDENGLDGVDGTADDEEVVDLAVGSGVAVLVTCT